MKTGLLHFIKAGGKLQSEKQKVRLPTTLLGQLVASFLGKGKMEEHMSSVVNTRKDTWVCTVNVVVAGQLVLALLAMLVWNTVDSSLCSKILLFITQESPVAFPC